MKTQGLSNFRHNGGFAYTARTKRFGLGSATLLENDIPLPGPANASHESIRDLGQGRYSFWLAEVYFSAPDNSDPRQNGRSYSFRYVENEFTRLGIFLYPFHWILKLFPNLVLLRPLKNPFKRIIRAPKSIRHLDFSSLFWSLLYWISFLYVTLLRRKH